MTTLTNTLEEEAVLAAVGVKSSGRRGRWTMEAIQECVHDNHRGTTEAAAEGHNDSPLVDVPDWLTPVLVGQLLERGLVSRNGTDPESYSVT
jgi:hypothetical protein